LRSQRKQCFDCIWLHNKHWECDHNDVDKFIVFSDLRRDKIQAIDDYDRAYAFYRKNKGVRNIDKHINKVKAESNDNKIPKEKFTIKFTM